MIIISLFDEIEFDDRGGGGYLEDEVTIRREKRFLGSVVLPFQVTTTCRLFSFSSAMAERAGRIGCFYERSGRKLRFAALNRG